VKKWLGIGVVDLAIQAVLTICVIGMGADRMEPRDQEIYIFGWLGVSVLVLAVRRHFALKKQAPETTRGEVAEQHLAELEMRLSDLEMSQGRLTELEERLDFAERVLSQKQEPKQEMLGKLGAN
jgi:hypothetical protein